MDEQLNPPKGTSSRRSFLGKSLAVGAGVIGAGLLAKRVPALAQTGNSNL